MMISILTSYTFNWGLKRSTVESKTVWFWNSNNKLSFNDHLKLDPIYTFHGWLILIQSLISVNGINKLVSYQLTPFLIIFLNNCPLGLKSKSYFDINFDFNTQKKLPLKINLQNLSPICKIFFLKSFTFCNQVFP